MLTNEEFLRQQCGWKDKDFENDKRIAEGYKKRFPNGMALIPAAKREVQDDWFPRCGTYFQPMKKPACEFERGDV
jgi:hypothetical protein